MANYDISTWKKDCIKIGSPTNLIAAFTAFLPVLYLCMKFGCWPEWHYVLAAWAATAASFGAFYVVEPVSYYASLGMAGTYLSFLSGNIGNMRVPCAALALDVTKSEAGTIQAEIVSTMAICGSIITNLIATSAAALCGAAIVAVLPDAISLDLKFMPLLQFLAPHLATLDSKSRSLSFARLQFLLPASLLAVFRHGS